MDVEEIMEVTPMIRRYQQALRTVDEWLNTLTTPEHGVMVGILALMSLFLMFEHHLLLLLLRALTFPVAGCLAYVAYRFSVRLEEKDDFE
jgi:hypothetical protein